MITPIRLSPTNIAGCNGINTEGEMMTGIIRFDKDEPVGPDSGVVLEFPNLKGIETAIERLQELKALWLEKTAQL